MKSIAFAVPALLALAACDGGTQGADTTAEEADADGNIVGNSSVVEAAGRRRHARRRPTFPPRSAAAGASSPPTASRAATTPRAC